VCEKVKDRESERECVCVCVRCACLCVCVRERTCACVRACLCERGIQECGRRQERKRRKGVCVCVCVCEPAAQIKKGLVYYHKSVHHEQKKAEQSGAMVEMHRQFFSVGGVGERGGLFLIVRVRLSGIMCKNCVIVAASHIWK